MSAIKFIMKDWKPANCRPKHNLPGIYAIGLDVPPYGTIYLYVGRSEKIARRLPEHFQPSKKRKQQINEFIQTSSIQVQRALQVKWVYDPRQQFLEEAYITAIEVSQGYRPVFNRRRGDGVTMLRAIARLILILKSFKPPC